MRPDLAELTREVVALLVKYDALAEQYTNACAQINFNAKWWLQEERRLNTEIWKLREYLAQFRVVWNHHMDTCPQHDELVLLEPPTFDEIREWANAPSNTASAGLAPSETSSACKHLGKHLVAHGWCRRCGEHVTMGGTADGS